VEATQFECRKRLVPAEALRLSELGRRALEEGMLAASTFVVAFYNRNMAL